MAGEGVGGRRLPVEGALALSRGEWRGVGGRVVGGRDGARRRGIRRAGREALKGGPQSVLAPRAGSSVRPEGLGSCCALKGLQGRNQRGTGLDGRRRGRWRREREKWRGKEGAGARPRASYWGAPRRTRLYWGMGGKGRGGYREGAEGNVPRCLRQRWVCAGGEPGKMGGLRERSGSLRGKVGGDGEGDWEISRRGLCWGGNALGLATGLWSESAAGRGSCRALGLLPHPQRGGDHFSCPSLSPS